MPDKRESFRKKLRKPRYSMLGKGVGNFYILCLSQKQVRLFYCAAETVMEMRLDTKIPPSLKVYNRFTEEITELVRVEGKVRVAEYLEEVADGIDRMFQGHHEPLILAAVEYEAAMFRHQCNYRYIPQSILPGNPDRLSPRDLHSRALEIAKKVARIRHQGKEIDTDQTSKQGSLQYC